MTSKQVRTRVLGQLLSMNYFGLFVGSLAVGVLFDITGYQLVFGAVLLVTCACLLTTVCWMSDSVAVVKSDSVDQVQSGRTRSDVQRVICL